jgi:ABC-type glycerol-3-phosphate transport system substrate-binding protein
MFKLSTFQIAILAFFGAIGVSGVLIFALFTGGGNSSTVGPVVIWGTFDEAPIQSMLRDATDNDPSFSEVQYVRVDPDLYETKLKDALASGKGPDLFIMRSDQAIRYADYAKPIAYTQLSSSQFQETFVDATAPYLGKEGVLAIPILADPLVLFWNKDALASAAIGAPPRYWEEIPAMVSQLVQKNEAGTVEKAGIALGNFDNIPAAKDIIATLILQAGAKIMAYDASGALKSAIVAQGGTQKAVAAVNFYTEFADPSKSDYSWSRAFKDALSTFASGDVALYIGHASDFKTIQARNPNLNFSVARLPQVRLADYALDTATVHALAVTRTSKNIRGATTIAWLLGAKTDRILSLANAFGMTSALRRVVAPPKKPNTSADSETNGETSALKALVGNTPSSQESLLNYSTTISKPWYDPDPTKTNAIFRDMIESTVSGAVQASAAVQKADKQLNEIIN